MMQEHNTYPEISVAPMMDWTDRHCRYFHRLIAPNALLYTEMITTGALLHGDRERFLRFDECEHPVALQLGGSDADDLATCSQLGQKTGYDEINLNCGCPSDRVQSGRFGACLMREPETVAACIAAMKSAVDIPVTVKCRIGVDDQDEFKDLDKFVDKVAQVGCETFIIHARKAWLKGLSPKENRDIPPLMYDRVAAVKEKYPHLRIILNGGITSVGQIQALSSSRWHSRSELARTGPTKDGEKSSPTYGSPPFKPANAGRGDDTSCLDGFMIGREAYQNPYFLAEIEQHIFGNQGIQGRDAIARAMADYAQRQAEEHGTPVKSITRHILGLYHHQKGAKAWKRTLSTLPYEDGADHTVILAALEKREEAASQASENAGKNAA